MSQDSRGQFQPPSGTPGQPQQPYGYPGQPAQPYQAPQPPQPGQPYQSPQPPQPYQSPQPGQPYQSPQPYPQPYPATSPYGGPAPYAPAAQPPKSPILGFVGLGIVVVAGIAGIITCFSLGQFLADLMLTYGVELDASTLPDEVNAAIAGQMGLPGLASFVGLVGWVISIVAMATARGRGAGIAGLILGILAPIAMAIAMFMPIVELAAQLQP